MVRTANENDAARIREIYSYYVENTAVTFDYEVPSEEEFKNRIRNTLKEYPYFVCVRNGKTVGYAYASEFKDRPAYKMSVETSVYVDRDEKGKGIGKELYVALENALLLQNVINLNACIAYPIEEDEYLTKDSVLFHKSFGYRLVGEFHKIGYKFGKWYNMVWMEKSISTHPEKPKAFVSFGEIKNTDGRYCND